MSDIARNAIIKLAIQLQEPNLKTTAIDSAVKAQEGLAQATKQATAATEAASKAAAEATQVTNQTAAAKRVESTTAQDDLEARKAEAAAIIAETQARLDAITAAQKEAALDEEIARASVNRERAYIRMEAAQARVGSSALTVAKGFLFMAAGQSESLNKLLPFMFALEGVKQVANGVATMQSAIAAAMAAEAAAAGAAATSTSRLAIAFNALKASLGPIAIAAGLVFVIFNRLQAIYRHFVPTQDEVNDRLEKQRALQDAANQSLDEARERYKILADAELERIELLQSQAEKSAALMQAFRGLGNASDPEHQARAGRDLLKILDDQRQAVDKQKRDAIELIHLRERELKTAQEALKSEQEKATATRASIGALDAGEKRRLEKLTSKVESGGTLTQKEAIDLKKLGGEAGQKIGEKFLAEMDKGLGQRLEKLIGDPLAKAQAEFERRQQSFNKVTGGRSADDAVAAVNEFGDSMAQSIDAVKVAITDKLRELIDAIRDEKLETSRQQSAQRAARAASAAK